LDAANAETFDRLADFAFEKHSNPHKRRKMGTRQRIVPTALAVAGSISAADHSETFPSLACCLRKKAGYCLIPKFAYKVDGARYERRYRRGLVLQTARLYFLAKHTVYPPLSGGGRSRS
jgi:hypothetical protein